MLRKQHLYLFKYSENIEEKIEDNYKYNDYNSKDIVESWKRFLNGNIRLNLEEHIDNNNNNNNGYGYLVAVVISIWKLIMFKCWYHLQIATLLI